MDLLYAKRSLRGQVFRWEEGGGGGNNRGDSGETASEGWGGGGSAATGNRADIAAGLANPTGQMSSMTAEQFDAFDTANYDSMTAQNRTMVDRIGSVLGLPGRAVASLFGDRIAGAMTSGQLAGTNSAYAGSASSSGTGYDGGSGADSGLNFSSNSGSSTVGGGSLADVIADAMSHDPNTQAFNSTKSAWDEWIKQRPGMQTQVDKLGTRGDAAYATSLTSASGMQGVSDNAVSDYNTVFRPNYQRLSNEVQRYGSQAYQDQMANEAMSGVQSNIDSQRQQLQRNRNRMGVNPASTGMDAQLAIGAATAKASAARDAVFGAKKAYTDGMTGMSSLGLKVADMGNTASTTAKSWGDYGLKSSAAGLSSGLELQRLGGTIANSTASSYTGIANAGSNRIQANNGTLTAQAAQDANNPWTTMGGAVISTVMQKWLDKKPGASIWD
jgi:hypothetical protein